MMKRLLALILAMVMLLSLFGCGAVPDDELGSEPEQGAVSLPVVSEPGESDAEQPDPAETVTLNTEPAETEPEQALLDPEGYYYSAEDVALYLVTYGCLPDNFITKNEARDLGWSGGSVERYAEGCAIGGDKFGNREGLLPRADGRQYYECDIDTNGANSRGAKRIVFSNDGLIYYTEDHYESFILLYGEE